MVLRPVVDEDGVRGSLDVLPVDHDVELVLAVELGDVLQNKRAADAVLVAGQLPQGRPRRIGNVIGRLKGRRPGRPHDVGQGVAERARITELIAGSDCDQPGISRAEASANGLRRPGGRSALRIREPGIKPQVER